MEEVVQENVKAQQEEPQVEQKAPETTPEPQEREYSDAELKAMQSGWKPKDQYSGDESKWVDAEEFNRRGELFGKIDVLSRELKESKKALRMLQEHHAKVRDTEYQRALTQLKAEKKAAYEEGNVDRIVEIDDQIAEVKASKKVEEEAIRQQVNQPDPRFMAWVDRNSWYAQDAEMRTFADATGTAYAANNPNKDPEEVLEYVAGKVRKAFPEKFVNPNRTKPSAVEGSAASAKSASTKKESYSLSEEEARVMHTFVRQGIMTKEEYIEQLKKIKGEA